MTFLENRDAPAPDFDSPEHQAELARLYPDLAAVGMTPLWTTRAGLMPHVPAPKAVPHLWRWAQLYPLAARSADLVPVGRGGERRAISLGNPGLPGDPYTTPTLWAAIQYLNPRENAPEQNARAFTPDGWYRSGDVVRRRPDGNLVVEGRDKDMINRGGEKISAEEVENVLYRLPQVAQVAAVAMPDPELGVGAGV